MTTDWYQQLLQLPALLPEVERRNRGGDSLVAALAQYRETERLPAAELAEQQRALLGMLAEHAVAQSPQFARRLAGAGLSPADLALPGGLQRLPPVRRRELVDAGASLFCRQVPSAHGRVASTSTSGSTGEPVTIRRTELNELHWSAATMREHLWHGRDFSQRLAIIRANQTARGEFASWGAPADRIVRTGPALVLPGTEAVGRLTDELEQFRPGYLLVLPSVLGGILDELAQRGGRLDGLREVRTLSETVPARLRERTREVLGVPIRDVYSSQEGGVMATQ